MGRVASPTVTAAAVLAAGAPRFRVTRRQRALLIGTTVYLTASIVMFWHVLALSPSGATTCSCSDVSQFTWFLEWPWIALRHLHNPFYTTAIFHPHGLNLLANTSVTGLGVPLMPFEALFGPVVTMNIALVVAPVASGAAMMWLAQRWVHSSAAAFVAGALYGFSPLVIFHEALGHLNVTFLAVPPLVVACWDELFWRRRHRPVRVGVALALLLSWQFFIGSEFFVMVVIASGVGLAGLLAVALLTGRESLKVAWRWARPGVLTAVSLTAVLLILPVSYALYGPGHYSGAVWPGLVLSNASVRGFLVAHSNLNLWWAPSRWHFLLPTYLSPWLIVAVVLGVVCWRGDRRLLAAAGLTAAMAWLALGQRYLVAPWRWVAYSPLFQDVVNERFGAFLALFSALSLAIVIDHVVKWRPNWRGVAAGVIVAVLAVAPYADDAVHVTPYSASRVWIPQWYEDHAATLPSGSVVLGFPFLNTSANLLSVQAIYHMSYSIVGGTTPQWLPFRQGAEAPGYQILWNIASRRAQRSINSAATASETLAVKSALSGWGVTVVVIPLQRGPNTSRDARDPAALSRWMTSVLGTATIESDAWVWHLDGSAVHR